MSGRFGVPVANRMTADTTVTAASPMVIRRPPGRMIGWPEIRPWSLPEAMSDPVNVIEPMMMSSTMKMLVSMRTASPMPARRR